MTFQKSDQMTDIPIRALEACTLGWPHRIARAALDIVGYSVAGAAAGGIVGTKEFGVGAAPPGVILGMVAGAEVGLTMAVKDILKPDLDADCLSDMLRPAATPSSAIAKQKDPTPSR